MELNKTYEDLNIKSVLISRNVREYTLEVVFEYVEKEYSFKSLGVREIENVSELMEATQMWINPSENSSQYEFGKLTLGFYSESFFEINFDELD